MIKKGDTLIEVTIAIGIFSLIAITIAAVMSSGTSGSQTALETTLAREEIDAQAEALRFIHESYITSKDATGGNPYYYLWDDIKGQAIAANSNSTTFNPSSCQDLYNNNILRNQKAFILNPRALESGNALIKYSSNSDRFQPTDTYPRIDYNGDTLSKAYGIYVVAVKDSGTNIVGQGNNNGDTSSVTAFYDFYIRTCWYGLDAERPSDISTVIRLYDPPTTQATSPHLTDEYVIIYKDGVDDEDKRYGANTSLPTKYIKPDETFELPNLGPRFLYWAYDEKVDDERVGACSYNSNKQCITAPGDFESGRIRSLYAQWDTTPFTITYDPAGGSFEGSEGRTTRSCDAFALCDTNYSLDSNPPTRPGYKFMGWHCIDGCSDPDRIYLAGGKFGRLPRNVVFKATWQEWYYLVYYNTDGTELSSCSTNAATSTFTISCGENQISNPGQGQKFYGWSPDDREPYYNNGDSITVPNSGDRTIRLYPVWRVSITFSSEGWTPSSSGVTESSCYIFNYSKPTNGSYYSIGKGTTYGSYNKAPADGYAVSGGGKHIEILDSGIINLQGYCHRAANESVSYTIGKNDTFELSAKMNTAGMRTHPGGYASISIGPITATINSNNITSKCQSSSGDSYSFTNGNVINLKIEKHSNDYAVSVNGKVLKSCTIATDSDPEVKYAMVHNDHYCSELFNVQLTDIDMQRYVKQ